MSHRLLALAGAAMVCGFGAPARADDPDPSWLGPTVPPDYHGRWNLPGACSPYQGRNRFVIAADHVIAAGDTFRTDYVFQSADGGIMISSKYVGPARSWRRDYFVRLERNRRAMLHEHARTRVRLVRCPR